MIRPSFAVLDRHPLVRIDVLALQVLQQIHRLDAIRLERLVRHAEKLRQRRPDGRKLHLELVDQHRFDVDGLLARRARREFELRGGNDRVADEKVILGLENLRLLALLERNGQRLAELRDAFLGELSEGQRRPCC